MQGGGLTVRRSEPLDRLQPRALQCGGVDPRAQPAAAVEEVVALLHEHLAQTVLQDFNRAADAGFDHRGECGVQDRVGGHELAPFGPGLVEVGQVAEVGGVGLAQRTAWVGTERLQASIEDTAVTKVVESHRRGGDIGLERGCARGPLRVAQAKHLLVVRDRQHEVGEAHASPGCQRWITSSLRTMAISHHRSSS